MIGDQVPVLVVPGCLLLAAAFLLELVLLELPVLALLTGLLELRVALILLVAVLLEVLVLLVALLRDAVTVASGTAAVLGPGGGCAAAVGAGQVAVPIDPGVLGAA